MTIDRRRFTSLVHADGVETRTLLRFLLLSLLLHVWFVLTFGSTTGGARRDLAPGDIFDVTLRQRIDESGSSFRWTPGARDSTSGSALLPRERAAPRPPAQAPSGTKPALLPPRANEAAQPLPVPEALPPEPIDAAPPAAPAVVLPAPEPLQRFNPDAPETVDKAYVPAPVPPPAPTPAPPPPAAVVPAPREVRPAPVVAPTTRPAPEAPPAIEREIAPPPPRETQPVRREAPVTERSDVPAEPAPRADVPPAPRTPTIDAAPLPAPRTAPPTIEREAQPPVEKPAPHAPTIEPAPRTPITEPTPRSEPIAAPPVRETVPAPASTTPAIAEPVAPREQRVAPTAPAAPVAPAAPAAPAAPPARSEPAPAAPPRLRLGEPAPDEDMFKPRRDVAPAADPGSAPKLDLDDAKRRATRDIVREGSGSRGLLSVVPPPPERESKEARALEKAVKPDCRTAYANMGLLATVPLVASAMTNSGCRW